jgi:hypothetical protein
MKYITALASFTLLPACVPHHSPEPPPPVWYVEDMTTTECDNAKGLIIWLKENP